jgi:glycerate 2-kinase
MPSQAFEDRERLRASMRGLARQLFLHAMADASIERAFERHVSCDRGVLRVSDDLFYLHAYSRVLVVSIGKAADRMTRALCDQVGESLEGIVAGPIRPGGQIRGFRYFYGGHPLPNGESLCAGEAILKSLTAESETSLVIFLLSGGGSAAVEKP